MVNDLIEVGKQQEQEQEQEERDHQLLHRMTCSSTDVTTSLNNTQDNDETSVPECCNSKFHASNDDKDNGDDEDSMMSFIDSTATASVEQDEASSVFINSIPPESQSTLQQKVEKQKEEEDQNRTDKTQKESIQKHSKQMTMITHVTPIRPIRKLCTICCTSMCCIGLLCDALLELTCPCIYPEDTNRTRWSSRVKAFHEMLIRSCCCCLGHGRTRTRTSTSTSSDNCKLIVKKENEKGEFQTNQKDEI